MLPEWGKGNNIQKTEQNTLKKGFSFFCSAELNSNFNWSKVISSKSFSLKTTAIINCSGPPPEGGTPIAAVSRIASLTLLQIRSISMELT